MAAGSGAWMKARVVAEGGEEGEDDTDDVDDVDDVDDIDDDGHRHLGRRRSVLPHPTAARTTDDCIIFIDINMMFRRLI
jgi:hypothetical protein